MTLYDVNKNFQEHYQFGPTFIFKMVVKTLNRAFYLNSQNKDYMVVFCYQLQ